LNFRIVYISASPKEEKWPEKGFAVHVMNIDFPEM
jgi:hypothetical protein